MDSGALLLPEPFSEKNIDGSPITKSSEGRALFRNSGAKERRVSDRRSGTDRRAAYSDQASNAPADTPSSYSEQAYNTPVNTPPSYSEQAYNTPVNTPPAYSAPVPSAPAYDPEKFDPPVDEKPGMIKNPLPMPPVKKKAAMDYDMPSGGYDDYDSPVSDITADTADPSMDAYGDYDYGDEGSVGASSDSYDDYGFGDDTAEGSDAGFGGIDNDDGYYGFGDEDSGASDSFGEMTGESHDSYEMPEAPDDLYDDGDSFGTGSDDFPPEDGDYGDYDDGGSDDDSDYGDYDSGSDTSSDYY